MCSAESILSVSDLCAYAGNHKIICISASLCNRCAYSLIIISYSHYYHIQQQPNITHTYLSHLNPCITPTSISQRLVHNVRRKQCARRQHSKNWKINSEPKNACKSTRNTHEKMYVLPDLSSCASHRSCAFALMKPYLSLFWECTRASAHNKLIISFRDVEDACQKKKHKKRTRNKAQATDTSQRSKSEKMKREDNDRYTILVLFKTMG